MEAEYRYNPEFERSNEAETGLFVVGYVRKDVEVHHQVAQLRLLGDSRGRGTSACCKNVSMGMNMALTRSPRAGT